MSPSSDRNQSVLHAVTDTFPHSTRAHRPPCREERACPSRATQDRVCSQRVQIQRHSTASLSLSFSLCRDGSDTGVTTGHKFFSVHLSFIPSQLGLLRPPCRQAGISSRSSSMGRVQKDELSAPRSFPGNVIDGVGAERRAECAPRSFSNKGAGVARVIRRQNCAQVSEIACGPVRTEEREDRTRRSPAEICVDVAVSAGRRGTLVRGATAAVGSDAAEDAEPCVRVACPAPRRPGA